MAAPSSYSPAKQVQGRISIARASVNNTTGDLVAAVTDKTIYVLGLHVLGAASQTVTLSTGSDTLLEMLATTYIGLNPIPTSIPNEWVVYHQTNAGEALKATTTQDTNFVVFYVQE